MRKYIDIVEELMESAETDFDTFSLIDDVVEQILSYFMEHSEKPEAYYGFKVYRFGSDVMATVSGNDIGLPAPFDELLFLFSVAEPIYNITGGLGKLSSGAKYVRINCAEDVDTIDGLSNLNYRILNVKLIHSILRHELVHFMDSFRNPRIFVKSQADSDNEYYNSPEEFNAFFHNVATKLMYFIKNAKNGSENIDMLARAYGITSDFNETLKNILKNYSVNEKKFLNTLNDRNKKAMYRRLFRLYTMARELTKE